MHHLYSDEKDYDVFLSYVWSPAAEAEGGVTRTPNTDKEGTQTWSVYGFSFSSHVPRVAN